MRDESILKKARMTFIDHLLVSLNFAQIKQYISSSRFSRCQYIPQWNNQPGTLMQKNNTGIIGN